MEPLNYIEVEQNSDQWFELRAGRITMSALSKVMANYGKAFGDPAKKYAIDIAVEQITGNPVSSNFSNAVMEQGHEREGTARQMYENETFQTVKSGGFFCNDIIGYSPDGTIGGKGGLEIKSSITTFAHYERVRKQEVDSAYRWQVIGALRYTGFEWLDYVSYCQDFPQDKQLFILRLKPENYQDEFKMIDSRVAQFLELIEKSKQTILNSSYFNQW